MSKKLFTLIKSLSQTEKTHFKKVSSKHIIKGQNVYMRLFDEIDKMDEYDVSKLQNFFETPQALSQLSAYSNYLFGNILDALKIYHARKSIESEIKHLILDVEMLYEKGMYSEANKIVMKARRLANKHEHFLLLLEITRLEEKLVKKESDWKLIQTFIDTNLKERDAILNKVSLTFHYGWLGSQVYNLKQKGGSHLASVNDAKALEELMQHPLLLTMQQANTIRDKSLYYHIHMIYNFIKSNRDVYKSSAFGVKYLVLLEENLDWTSANLAMYLSLINNLMVNYIEMLEVEKIDQLIEKLKIMPERFSGKMTGKEENIRITLIHTAFLIRCSIKSEFEKGLSSVRGKEVQWEKAYAQKGAMELLVFYNNMRALNFAIENFKAALFWNNKIINESEFLSDVQAIAIIWNIIIHYNIGNIELVEKNLKSVISILDGEDGSITFGKLFVNNMHKILKANYESQAAVRSAFSIFKNEVIRFKETSMEMTTLAYVAYIGWIDSHIEGRKFHKSQTSK